MNTAAKLMILADNNELDVEAILALVRTATRADVPSLRAAGYAIGASLPGEVPYEKWIECVCDFLEQGEDGLLKRAVDPMELPFVLGVVEELPPENAVSILDSLVQRCGGTRHTTLALVTTANLVLAVGEVPSLTPDRRVRLLGFLHGIIGEARPDDPAYGMALYALRGIGDDTTLMILSGVPDAIGPYAGAKRLATAAIRDRLRTAN